MQTQTGELHFPTAEVGCVSPQALEQARNVCSLLLDSESSSPKFVFFCKKSWPWRLDHPYRNGKAARSVTETASIFPPPGLGCFTQLFLCNFVVTTELPRTAGSVWHGGSQPGLGEARLRSPRRARGSHRLDSVLHSTVLPKGSARPGAGAPSGVNAGDAAPAASQIQANPAWRASCNREQSRISWRPRKKLGGGTADANACPPRSRKEPGPYPALRAKPPSS